MLLLATALATLAASGPAGAAAPGTYRGTTDGGHDVSFRISGGKVRAIDALVPTSCVPTTGAAPRAGAERFQPPGAFAVGATRKVEALQDAAMHHDAVTKHGTVALTKKRRGGFGARLRLSFSFQTLDPSGWDGPRLVGWVCQGDDAFSVR